MKRQLVFVGIAIVLPLLALAAGLHGLAPTITMDTFGVGGVAVAQGPGTVGTQAVVGTVGTQAVVGTVGTQAVVGTGFTYQGQLLHDGSPITDTCSMKFWLFDGSGGQAAAPLTLSVPVTNGLFTVALDFGGGVFNGEARSLDIQVACPAGGSLQELGRQPLTPAPYALALPGLWTQQTVTSPNLIGGYSGNSVSASAVGATIGGGGNSSNPNQVTADYGTVGGGEGNKAITGSYTTVAGGSGNQASSDYAAVGGGQRNKAIAGMYTTVAGGQDNQASGAYAAVGGGISGEAKGTAATVPGGFGNHANGNYATIGGGNYNEASGPYATIGGGDRNDAITGTHATIAGGYRNQASGDYATVGGGYVVTASDDYATVGGGYQNQASWSYATVAGGRDNQASGRAAAVPGGENNLAAGDHSFAAGQRAHAHQNGCFVWGDDSINADVNCNTANAFIVRTSGGATFYSNSGMTAGVRLSAGDGSWADLSDRALKANVVSADGGDVLARLMRVPVSTWNYTSQDPSIRHMGPMAQDFYAAFGLGVDDRHISTVDADGVALAAIQALAAENAALRARLDSLEARLAALEAGGGR